VATLARRFDCVQAVFASRRLRLAYARCRSSFENDLRRMVLPMATSAPLVFSFSDAATASKTKRIFRAVGRAWDLFPAVPPVTYPRRRNTKTDELWPLPFPTLLAWPSVVPRPRDKKISKNHCLTDFVSEPPGFGCAVRGCSARTPATAVTMAHSTAPRILRVHSLCEGGKSTG
jgi:hypothetical protein